MVRASRLLWDNPSLRPDDSESLRRLEHGDDERSSPMSRRPKRRPRNRRSDGEEDRGGGPSDCRTRSP